MSLGHNPQIKFQPCLETREGLEKIASVLHIGQNGDSANEVMRIAASQLAKVAPRKFFAAMAALDEFSSTSKPKSRSSTNRADYGLT